jgi:endonuclease/exonuclease/phosphatase family metal-dependent hydrolase
MSARPEALRIVTWNIHKGIGGVDRRYRLERVVETLQQMRPDVVLMQEVDEGVPRSKGERQVDLIGDAIELRHRAYEPHKTLTRGHYGNAILSRFPLEHTGKLDLSKRLRIKRAALHARLSIPLSQSGRKHLHLWIYNVHLGLEEWERRGQLRRVLDWHASHHPTCPDTAVLVGGDFNDVWNSLGKVVLEPEGFRGQRTRALTFPAFRPLRPLDAVFVRGPLDVHSVRAVRDGAAARASDHLPLLALLEPVG